MIPQQYHHSQVDTHTREFNDKGLFIKDDRFFLLDLTTLQLFTAPC